MEDYVCPKCGSTEILFDAKMEWYFREQKFTVYEQSGSGECGDCGAEFDEPKTIEKEMT